MMKRNWMHRLGAFAAAAALVLSLAGCGAEQSGGPADVEPVQLTVWTYYNGDQLESFNRLVEEFNATVGKEQNITVENCSQGNVNDLEAQVMASAQGKVGAEEMPNIFMAYADTAYAMDQMSELVDLAPYFTDEERAVYIGSYLTEGDFNDDGSIKIFPVAKSVELLFLNDTDWQTFADATGAEYADLETIEGLVGAAEAYYNWTDAQTETPDDGKAPVWPRRDGELYAHRRKGAGRHPLRRQGRQDDRGADRGHRPQAVGQLLCALRQGLVLRQRPLPQRRY